MDKPVFTLETLAQLTGSQWVGNPHHILTGCADLEAAGAHDVSFLSNPRYTKTRYLNTMKQSKAGAFFVAPSVEREEGKNYLIHSDPSRAFQTAIEAMRGSELKRTGFEGIHPSAIIHPQVSLGNQVTVGPRAVIDEGVEIGEGSFIGAGVYIGPYSRIGKDCVIYPNVTIREHCLIGDRVIIQPNAAIGSCGFGYTTSPQGIHQRLTHIGTVTIEDDVEIGANATIDRSRFTTTRIGKGTKIDNAVVVGHNVSLGRHNIICGQTGLAGSAKTGDYVVIAGQCGIDGHIKLEDGVIVSARSGITKSLKKGRYGGFPAVPIEEHRRHEVHQRHLGEVVEELKALKEELALVKEELDQCRKT